MPILFHCTTVTEVRHYKYEISMEFTIGLMIDM